MSWKKFAGVQASLTVAKICAFSSFQIHGLLIFNCFLICQSLKCGEAQLNWKQAGFCYVSRHGKNFLNRNLSKGRMTGPWELKWKVRKGRRYAVDFDFALTRDREDQQGKPFPFGLAYEFWNCACTSASRSHFLLHQIYGNSPWTFCWEINIILARSRISLKQLIHLN